MKKIAALLFALLVFITIKAQKKFDTSQDTKTSVKENSLLQGQTAALTDNFSPPTNAKKAISVLPEAGTKNVKISFDSKKAAGATITVLDQDGKMVQHQATLLSVGGNTISINNFSLLKEGNYSIQLNTNKETYTSTIMIWN